MSRLKPCIGCENDTVFRKGDLCQFCKSDLAIYAAIKESQGRKSTAKTVSFPASPYVPQQAANLPSAGKLSSSLKEMLINLADGKIVENDEGFKEHQGRYRTERHYLNHSDGFDASFKTLMTDDGFQAYSSMLSAIGALIQESYLAGQARGQDLLFQLNAGEITQDKFNEKLASSKRFQRN